MPAMARTVNARRARRATGARHGVRSARASQRTRPTPHWEIKVLLRASDVLDRCGDHDDAITLQTRAMELMVRHPDVGRCHRRRRRARPLDRTM